MSDYQAQERQLAIQQKKGARIDRARVEALVFRLARQESDVWVTWSARVAALMAAQVAAELEKRIYAIWGTRARNGHRRVLDLLDRVGWSPFGASDLRVRAIIRFSYSVLNLHPDFFGWGLIFPV